MKKDNLHSVLSNEGRSRADERPKMLMPESVALDDRSFLDFVAAVRKEAALKAFPGEESLTWIHFFEHNPIFILSEIRDWPLEEWLERFSQLRNRSDQIKKIVELATLWDHWLHKAAMPQVMDLAEALRQALRLELQKHWIPLLGSIVSEIGQDEAEVLQKIRFFKAEKFMEPQVFADSNKEVTSNYLAQQIEESFRTLRLKIPALLSQLLAQKGLHEAQVGALVSFIQTNEHLQAQFNELSRDLLRYFYVDILQQQAEVAKADEVVLCLPTASHISTTFVEAKTRLVAGMYDDGREIEYELKQALQATDAEVRQIRQLYLAQNPAVGITQELRFISGIYARDLVLDEHGFVLDSDQQKTSVPVFGMDQLRLSQDQRKMQNVDIGFAVANPLLFLSEGHRKIQMHFELEPSSLSALVNYIEALSSERQISADAAFQLMMENIFHIEYSTLEGWHSIDRYGISMIGPWSNAIMGIDIELGPSEPVFSALSAELHGQQFEPGEGLPHLRFTLQAQNRLYGYAFVKDLQIRALTLDVQVEGLEDLFAYNAFGDIDVRSLFSPFGVPADAEAYFCVGHKELAAKKLEQITVEVDWFNVPRNEGGLSRYFRAYSQAPTTQDYSLNIQLKSDRRFQPQEDVERVALFEENADGSIKRKSVYTTTNFSVFNYEPLFMPTSVAGKEASCGVIKLSLNAPDMVFGDRAYPMLLSSVVMKNATEKNPEKHKPLPNEPINPQIQRLSISYRSSVRIEWSEERQALNNPNAAGLFYHLHPFKSEVTFKEGKVQHRSWLPEYKSRGHLYLALEGGKQAEYLSLYFHMKEAEKGGRDQSQKVVVQWQFLSGSDWQNFSQADVIMDGTNGLRSSGILRLKIPELLHQQILQNYAALEQKVTWIRAITDSSSDAFPELVFIKNNAVNASWHRPDKDTDWPGQLKAHGLERLAEGRAELAEIIQPFASAGGSKKETEQDFYTRVAHRISHKNRPIRPQDIESYVLDTYEELYQVRCFTATEHHEAGFIYLVCVPKVDTKQSFYLPSLPEALRLKIQSDVQSRLSTTHQLRVINPVFERLRLRAKIALIDGVDRGQILSSIHQHIRKFLCAWFASPQERMKFGWLPSQEELFSSLEQLAEIRFISAFSLVLMQHEQEGTTLIDTARSDMDETNLALSKAWSVVVPDQRHSIEIIEESEHSKAIPLQISQMQIGDDFVLGAQTGLDMRVKSAIKREDFYRITIK